MKKVLITLILLLNGCHAVDIPPEFHYKEIQTSYFNLASWQKITDFVSPFKIYIEGDGYAFRADGSVSSDPTPHGTLLREIAFADPHPNVIYLARPCQYIKDDKCLPIYWSTARFSNEVIQSEYEAVKQIINGNPITLVGFSGGAQISGLIVVKHPDIKVQKLVTIAGNLDVKSWIEYHKLPPLTLSDDLAKYKYQYAKFNQIHYVGLKDDNIIPTITENFVVNHDSVVKIKNASHNKGWEAYYNAIRQE